MTANGEVSMREHFSVLLVAIAMTVPVTGSDTQEPEAPKTELQKFHLLVEEINAQAINAGTKLRGGAVSMSRGSKDTPATPAEICCGRNIDKIAKQLDLLATRLQKMRSCYRARRDAEAEVRLNFVAQDATSLFRAMGNFSNAKNEADVQSGYGAVAKSLLQLQKSAKELTECEPSGSP